MLNINEKLSEVQLLRLRATFHLLPIFLCKLKFYARTHINITRHWKSTLAYLVSGHLGEGINKAKRQALVKENFQDIGSGEEVTPVTTYVL